jgi:ATP-dependent DNA helicase RecG
MTVFEEPSIERILESDEGQLLDFKSARIHPRDLADILIAFANADGGLVAIGIEKDIQITGIRRHGDNVQSLLRAAFDYCEPAVKVETRYLDCYNERGEPDQVLLMQVARSSTVHNNTHKTVYLRVGGQNRRLGVQEVLQLAYDKGQANYESELAQGATYDDLDEGLLKRYAQMIEARGDLRDLLVARELAQRDGKELCLNLAGVLLFSRKPDHWHPRPGIRFLRYEGTQALTGAAMNIVKDRTIEQPLPKLLDETFALVGTLIREFSHFGSGGKFVVTPEYPEFVWQEGITNAVAHRAYNITGRPVEVLMFDDRLEIISPGPFPGTVSAETIRHDHFSRNPRIARVLAEMRYIKDIGEGVDRMYQEMDAASLPPPEWIEEPSAVRLILRNGIEQRWLATPEEVRARATAKLNDRQRQALEYVQEQGSISNHEYRQAFGVSNKTAYQDLQALVEWKMLQKVGQGKQTRYVPLAQET